MAFNKVEICGVNTSKLPILSAKEKAELFEEIKKGNEEAKKKYIYGNLRLVLSVIQRFSNRGEVMDDLFQVGCIGLIKAINNFDTEQNVQFSTYAVPMIIGEVRRYLRDNNSIRVSRSLRDTAYKALQAKERLTNKLSREPKIEEIAKELSGGIRGTAAARHRGGTAGGRRGHARPGDDPHGAVCDRGAGRGTVRPL